LWNQNNLISEAQIILYMDSKIEELELQTWLISKAQTHKDEKKKKQKQRKPQYLQWNTKQTESLKQTFNDFE